VPRLSIHVDVGGAFAFLTVAACLGLACAADSGDPLKSSSSPIGSNGSSSSGGSSGSSGASSGSSSGFGSSSSGGGSSSGSGGGSSGSGSGSGSGSNSGGSSGAADGGTDAATGPTCVTTSKSVAVAYYTQDTATSTAVSTVQFNLQLTNGGFTTVALSDVTVRYWFTNDSNALAGNVFVSYYSTNGSTVLCMPCPSEGGASDIAATFAAAPPANVTPTSDSYLELSFSSAAGNLAGALNGGAGAAVQVAFHGPNYSYMFNETNDYSFDATKKAAAPQTSITAYVKGQLVWGCEPGSGASGSSSGGGTDAGGGMDATGAASSDAAGE
jgi:hypothetical protein